MNNHRGIALALLIGLLALFLSPALAQAQTEDTAWIEGPQTVDLGDNLAQLEVGEAYVFAGAEDTREIMKEMGNPTSGTEIGLLVPKEGEWFVLFEYDAIGYVPDDEKDTLDAAAILQSIREGTEEANKVREEQGFPPIHVIDWHTEPYYDETTHNLVWTIAAESEREGVRHELINHNVRILGRRGATSATLAADPEQLPVLISEVDTILKGFSYKSGSRYAEYVQGDKLAGYGLAALVAGGAGAAAAKGGLFKLIGKYLRLIIFGALAVLGALWKSIRSFFGARNEESATG